MTEALLDHPAVARVRAALAAAGSAARVVALADTARTAQDAANALNVPVGAIVKSLVFASGGRAVMALVAGDKHCDTAALGAALGLAAPVKRADADLVRAATGFAIGGVAPLGHASAIPIAIDANLKRFPTVYAAAGHPHCVFATTVEELATLTGGRVIEGIGR
ncbi:MAG: YbaK/EbsC family protein [Alphaproteobacteria bacterium]|nr:YbaK/EbsC family protein [Alphaproteobacteria bacterium]